MTHILEVRNVSYAYAGGLWHIKKLGVPSGSRAGDVLVLDEPVLTIYHRPQERVLLDPDRDANPYFHLMESLWMLAGRQDAGFLNNYVRDFGARFAEEDGHLHGAYGYRWRHHFGYDQIAVAIARLRANPQDRRTVISMFDPDEDLGGDYRDIPCNTNIFLRVRSGVLDMSVQCRSNDVVWGAYGANAVHFSMLQEYLAGKIEVGVGVLHQYSWNFHGYKSVVDRLPTPVLDAFSADPYTLGEVGAMPIGEVGGWARWDDDLLRLLEWIDDGFPEKPVAYTNLWFESVAARVARSHYFWKIGEVERAISYADGVVALDWRAACLEWLERRIERRRRTEGVGGG